MLYDHASYKEALKTVLLERREQLGKSYTFQNMAKACRVQKTYLSRVFNGDAHLNDDQLYLACTYLGLGEDEQHYLGLLHQHERSIVAGKKGKLSSQIELVRRRRHDSQIKAAPLESSTPHHADFYLDPAMQLVHIFLTIPRYRNDIGKIKAALHLNADDLASTLTKLQRLGLIAYRDGRYEVVRDSIHLPPDSPVYKAGRALLRLRAMDKIDRLPPAETFNFSVVFSATETVRARIQMRFQEFLKSVEDEVKAAPAEEVYQMSFDLFGWSK
jgi:hypothetical protein